MALLFFDGFDHYTGELSNSGKWTPNGVQNYTTYTTVPRTGSRCASGYYASDEALTPVLPVSGKGFVLGVAIRVTSVPYNDADFLRVKEGSSNPINHLMLTMSAGGILKVKGGSGTVMATGTYVFPANSWVHVEFKGVIDDTAGSYAVRIDGELQPELTASGVDTRNAGTGQWDRVALCPVVPAWVSYVDDFYVCDQSGTVCNDFLGPVRIETLLPQVGNGSNVGLTPSIGTDHGALVDEVPGNTTDYNSGSVAGLKDTYNLPSLTTNGDVMGVQVNMFVSKSDAGARRICGVVRVGGQDYDGSAKPMLTTWAYVPALFPLNPAAVPPAPWTKADIDAMEAGMKVVV